MADAEEDEKTLADTGAHGPVNRDGSTADPLDDCPHLLEVLFYIILHKGKKYLVYDKCRQGFLTRDIFIAEKTKADAMKTFSPQKVF